MTSPQQRSLKSPMIHVDRNTYEKLYQFAVDKLHGYDDLQVM